MSAWLVRVALVAAAACACVLVASRFAAHTLLEVRTQPLELSAGPLVSNAPLVQIVRGRAFARVERASAARVESAPAGVDSAPATAEAMTRASAKSDGASSTLEPEHLASVELAGQWRGPHDPSSVTLRIRARGASGVLRETRGTSGSRADRVRFEFTPLDFAADTELALEFACSSGAFRSPFAPFLRPRARLGARARGEIASSALRELELTVESATADFAGVALQLAESPGGRVRWSLARAPSDVALAHDDSVLARDEPALARGELELAPTLHASLPLCFEPLAASRGERYTLRVEFERDTHVWQGRAGPAHIALHGRARADARLGGASKDGRDFAACDLVISCGGEAPRVRPSTRELAGWLALTLAASVALLAARARAS